MFRLLFLATLALFIPLFFLLLFISSIYNKLASLRNRCQETYARLDAKLKQLPPNYKSAEGLGALTQELASAQTEAAAACRAYNDAVTNYNTFREGFPNKLIARMFYFYAATPFESKSF